MWQWFLRAVQVAIVAFFFIGDVIENYSDGRPGYVLIIAIAIAFGVTQALIGIKWLLTKRNPREKRIR